MSMPLIEFWSTKPELVLGVSSLVTAVAGAGFWNWFSNRKVNAADAELKQAQADEVHVKAAEALVQIQGTLLDTVRKEAKASNEALMNQYEQQLQEERERNDEKLSQVERELSEVRAENRKLTADLQKLRGHNEHLEQTNAELTRRNDELLLKWQMANQLARDLQQETPVTT